MLGLNERAKLYKRTGQHAGKPAYADDNLTSFSCRTQPEVQRVSSGNSVERTADTRLFMHASDATLAINTGDKIVLDDGTALIVTEVQRMRGFSSLHHLEVLAVQAGD